MTSTARLDSFRRFLTHLRERTGFAPGFVLWDGSTVPADLPADALAVSIADEGAVAALLRKPKIDTFANLWASARIDIRNGTIFDLVAQRPKVRTRDLMKSLDKRLVVSTLLKFLTVSRGGPWPLENTAVRGTSDNSEGENKENISYHYDVSNTFYTLFLDTQMLYSCAYFTDWSNDLDTAQRDKLDMICRKLRLQPGERFLDIGCGWGALVCHAAEHYGVIAHGVTLSEEQLALARERIASRGLSERITVELKNYHALGDEAAGKFDKIASIGMFEHVGIDNHPAYFATINRLLRPRGLYLHHAIARPAKRTDKEFRKHRPEFAALVRYIFPGGELDHIGMSAANLERHGFEVHDVEGWREHYGRTCRLWHDRLLANKDAAIREVGSVKMRMWLAYFAGCAIAFDRSTVGIFQTLASKKARGPSGLPPTRADLYRPG
ncbi:MAG: class I SAM-dependent methyltransferase [Rhizobiales bacterium]|nr:class I SAM-dependent methyltransferase [Hyphomicrobiales bacterium]OJY41655.1 MAG: cyclopropane-fatty-acyl-phospholipid synthase [Rhizobiales bacterium 64-17]